MGVQSEAFLVYGIDIGNKIPRKFKPNEDDGAVDFSKFICTQAGLDEPAYNTPEYSEFYEKRKALLESYPVDMCLYGRDFDSCYVVFVRGHAIAAHNVSTARVDPSALTIPEEKLAALKAFCKAHRIACAKPSWFLVTRRC